MTGASVDANGNVLPGVPVGTYNIAGERPAARSGSTPEIQRLVGHMPLPNYFTDG